MRNLLYFCKNRGLMVRMCWKLNLKIMILLIENFLVSDFGLFVGGETV